MMLHHLLDVNCARKGTCLREDDKRTYFDVLTELPTAYELSHRNQVHRTTSQASLHSPLVLPNMASMAETLAASSRQNVPSQSQNSAQSQTQNSQSSTAGAGGPNKASIAGKGPAASGEKGAVPARYEEFLDVEGEIPIEGVELGGMVCTASNAASL